jgi:hypothetical protein
MADFKNFMETMTKESKDEWFGIYRFPDKRFEVWIRIVGDGVAKITHLRGFGKGNHTFKDVIPELKADLQKLNIKKIEYSTALDDKTQGKARDRLFQSYLNSQGIIDKGSFDH